MNKLTAVLLGILVFPGIRALPLSAEPADLSGLLEEARQSNLEYREAEFSLARSETGVAAARAARGPSAETTLSGIWFFNPQDAVSFSTGDLGLTVLGVPDQDIVLAEAQDPLGFVWGMDIRQPMFTWGRLSRGVQMAEAGRKSALLGREKTLSAVNRQIVSLYYSLYYLQEIRSELEAQGEVSRQMVLYAESTYRQGILLETDLLDARVRAADTELALLEVQGQMESALASLSYLTGRERASLEELDFQEIRELAGAVEIPGGEELYRLAGQGNPDLQLLAVQTELSRMQRLQEEAVKNGRPELALTLQLQYSGSGLPGSGDNDWNNRLVLGARVPLYDGGLAEARAGEARLDEESARNRQEQGSAEIRRQLRELHSRLILEEQKILQARAKAASEAGLLAVTERELAAGQGERMEYYGRQIDLGNRKVEVSRSLLDYHLDLFSLCGLTGIDPEVLVRGGRGF